MDNHKKKINKMKINFWKSSLKDTAKNGTVVGGLMGLFIVIGDTIVKSLKDILPSSWLILGDLSVPIYIILVSVIVGYAIDKW